MKLAGLSYTTGKRIGRDSSVCLTNSLISATVVSAQRAATALKGKEQVLKGE